MYRFKYKNVRATGWYDGFYLGFKAANIYWLDGGVQVDFNDDSTVLHCFNGSQAVLETTQSPSIESGKEYEIEFGLLKAGDDTVKVHLTINGTPYFADVEVKNSVFVSTPLYFGFRERLGSHYQQAGRKVSPNHQAAKRPGANAPMSLS